MSHQFDLGFVDRRERNSSTARLPRVPIFNGVAAIFLAGLVAFPPVAQALTGYNDTWNGIYTSSNSGRNAGCALCHATTGGGSSWNAYGWAIRQLGTGIALANRITNASVQSGNSDGNPANNLAEINASAQPGWTTGANNSTFSSTGVVTLVSAPAGIGLLDPPFTVGGNVSGLTGSVTLRNNGGDSLVRNTNGTFTFATALATGSAYAVTVFSQPPGQTCTVTNGSGTIGSANVTNVAVTCVNTVTATPGQLRLPSPVTFPSQLVGTQSAPLSVVITNIGGSTVAISNVLASNSAEFPGTTNCAGSIVASASCQIVMSFRPASAGLRTQTVTIVSDGVGSPQTFQISGTGSTGITQSFVPVPGVWWNKDESGSGLGLDYQNGTLIVEVYSYLAGGSSQWYLAAGALTNNVFTATLDKYTGGQCISCAYQAPGLAGNDGTITITFTSPTTATADLPGGRHIAIQRFFSTPPTPGVHGATIVPVGGVWWNKNESGSGFGLDYENGTLIAEVYSYLAGGASQWYLAAGSVTNNVFTATLDKYTGGQCISCTYKAPALSGNDGTITITFTSPTTATVDLPGGRHIQIERFFQP